MQFLNADVYLIAHFVLLLITVGRIVQLSPSVHISLNKNKSLIQDNNMPIKVSTAFYDAMFDNDCEESCMNKIEEQTLANVRETLNSPEKLSEKIPPLPVIVIKLLEVLKDSDANFLDLVAIIEQDPALAVQVIKVANTAKYARGDESINSLRRAVNVLGASGVAKIATTIMIEKIMPAKPIYHKMFGRQIWLHSLHCAYLCKLLADCHNQDKFDAHFLGLIHDVGKILIFECLCNAFSSECSDCVPGSLAFKELMSEMSVDISYFIAVEWQLPSIYCEALQQQHTNRTSILAKLLYKANIMSELYLLHTKGLVAQDKLAELLKKLSVKEKIWQDFLEIAPEIELT